MDHIRCATQYLRTTETKDKSRPPDRTWGDRSVAHEGVKQWTQTRQRRLDAKSTAVVGDSWVTSLRCELQLAKAKGQVYNIQIPVANSVDMLAHSEPTHSPPKGFVGLDLVSVWLTWFELTGFRYKFRWIPHLDLSSSFELDTWYPIHPPSAHLASATRFIPQFLTYLSSPPTRLPLQAHRSTPTTTVQMPHNMDPFPASLPEQTRKNMMAALCRLAVRAPIEAAEAYLNLRPYKEHPGFVYTHLRPNWEVLDNAPNVPMGQLDWVDIKVGKAEDMEDRQLGYELTCVGEPIAWAFCYETSRPKLIERLTHLTLWEMGAKRVPYACRGCGVRHREHFSEAVSGGLEIVALIIEYWMRKIGEQPTRILLDECLYIGRAAGLHRLSIRVTRNPQTQPKACIDGRGEPHYGVGSLVKMFGLPHCWGHKYFASRCATQYLRTTDTKDKSGPPDRTWGACWVAHEGVKQWAAEAGRKVDSRGWTQSRQRRRIFSVRKEKKDVLGNGEAGSGFESVGLNLASVWVTCFEPTGFPLRVPELLLSTLRQGLGLCVRGNPIAKRPALPQSIRGLRILSAHSYSATNFGARSRSWALFEPDPQQGIRNFPELIPLTLRRVLGLCVQALQPLCPSQMPHNMDPYAAGLLEETRKKTMAALCRLAARAPIEAAEAYLNLRPYKERPGFVYTHLRPNWEVLDDAPNVPVAQLDWVDIKVGQAVDLEERQLDYELDCVDEPIGWVFCYETSRPKLIKRLTHLTLWEMGAKRVPYPCRGCGVRHREHFSEVISGGVEVVGLIIEYWMRRIGEQPTRILLDE
ncbi:hypothetical protein DFH06DRAFT_1133443 [Mycena polygramma]|nr:hypothetical protein DFH06DRAFT_1133443 [Mycena polygramma]